MVKHFFRRIDKIYLLDVPCINILFKTFELNFLYQNIEKETTRYVKIHAFFISNSLKSNARLKLTENQANAKQHPEAELLLFENYSHSSSTLSSKNNRTYSKK